MGILLCLGSGILFIFALVMVTVITVQYRHTEGANTLPTNERGTKMKVLVACEESQEVCKAFRERGHEAYSCDIQECSGGHPEWHIKGDVLDILNPKDHGNNTLDAVWFTTMDGRFHEVPKWDLIIAHPPCTYLSVAGNRWFDISKYGEKAKQRIIDRACAVEFFMKIVNANCEKIAIENPIGYMNTHYRKPDQITHPYNFGVSNNKPICLWLKGLQPLTATNIVSKGETKRFPCGSVNSVCWSGKTAKARSKTFPGIAKAMAEQWGYL